MWVLKPRILSRSWRSKPLMTLITMMSTATPNETPSTEINVMTETNVLLGRRYRSASSSSNGRRDMCGQAKHACNGCQRTRDAATNFECPQPGASRQGREGREGIPKEFISEFSPPLRFL